MEDRIRFIAHRGKQVLLMEVTNCNTAEMIELGRLVPRYVSSEPHGSVLLLADFTGSKFDKAAVETLKQAAVFDRPHISVLHGLALRVCRRCSTKILKPFPSANCPHLKFAGRH